MLLHGVDIKIVGSLSLAVSLPTMLVAFARYSRDKSFLMLRGNGTGYSVSLAREQHPHTVDQQRSNFGSCLTAAIRGAPDAMRVA